MTHAALNQSYLWKTISKRYQKVTNSGNIEFKNFRDFPFAALFRFSTSARSKFDFIFGPEPSTLLPCYYYVLFEKIYLVKNTAYFLCHINYVFDKT